MFLWGLGCSNSDQVAMHTPRSIVALHRLQGAWASPGGSFKDSVGVGWA